MVYDAQPTYNMLLPISIIMNYWYLLPFINKPSNFQYPPKDYVTWASLLKEWTTAPLRAQPLPSTTSTIPSLLPMFNPLLSPPLA